MAKAQNILGIDWQGPASDAIRAVLLTRFEEMCALRDHALDWSDPEGVHDMRVSSRRLRGALRDFAPYLHRSGLSDALKGIRDLADVLGAVRDQDVAIIGLQKLAAGAPDEAGAMLDQLVQARGTIRSQARKDLQKALQTRRMQQLRRDFVAALESATAPAKPRKRRSKNSQVGSDTTYQEIARTVIMERLKEVEKLSEALYRPLKSKPLHKMRIGAKRLRYAIELFEICWGPGISTYAKGVSALQSSLGELHDADVWIETFGQHLNDTHDQPKDRIAASLWLLSHFVKLRSKHLRDTLAKWRDWETNESGSRLRDFLKQDPAPTAKPSDASPPEHEQADSQSQRASNGLENL